MEIPSAHRGEFEAAFCQALVASSAGGNNLQYAAHSQCCQRN